MGSMIYKTCHFEVKADVETRIIKGWASVFNVIDLGRDMMMPGAFKDSIKRRKGLIPILWQHRSDKAIGTPRILEERKDGKTHGLYFESNPLSKTQTADEALVLIKDKVVTGASVGIKVTKRMWVDADEEKGTQDYREIHKAELFEFSPVSLPMNESARLLSMSKQIDINELADRIRKGELDDDEIELIKSALSGANPVSDKLSALTTQISKWRLSLKR